jgi:serine/threonine protein kinase
MAFERLGPYVVERRIGRGGMGTVFAARADVTGDVVAVKVLSALHGLEEGVHERFSAEIESLRMLHHPNIVRILGYGEEDGCPYYAMELVDGASLQDALDEGRKFSWSETIRIGVQTCRALKHAHDRGIVHRDIKPGNVLLMSDGSVKLSDFGIAKSFGNASMTADGGVLGTAEYMSPEQADGRPATQRSDLYSLGGLLYALLAGRPPFRAKSLLEMLQLQRFAEPEPLVRVVPSLPRALNDLVLQLLHKDPTKRMPNAMMTARALEAAAAAVSNAADGGSMGALLQPIPLADDDDFHLAPAAKPPSDGRPAVAVTTALPPAMAAANVEFSLAPAVVKPAPAAPAAAAHPAVAPQPKAPTPPKQILTPLPDVPFVTRTYTPVDRDDHRKFEPQDEAAPVWISPHTWGLVATMLSLGLAAWYWLQPPSAERLYSRISEAAAQDKIERLLDVERDIRDFVDYYSMDRRVRELQTYLQEIDLYRLERKFQFRGKFMSKNEALAPIERAYIEAMGYVNLDPTLGRKKLQSLLDLFRDVPESNKRARECLNLARRQLDRLQQQAAAQDDDDRKLIETQLAHAEALQDADPDGAARIRRAVVELYGDEPWAEPLVRTAREALAGRSTGIARQQP